MKKKGICFFTDYATAVPLLVVALYSLRKNYAGNICVVYGNNTPDFFKGVLQRTNAITDLIATDLKFPKVNNIVRLQRCFNIKPKVHKICPYDVNMMYDCDHLFVNRFDESAFETIKGNGLISFHKDKHDADSNKKALQRTNVLKSCGINIPFLKQVNGGCVGSAKGSALIDEWINMLDKMLSLGNHIFIRLPDEYALSYVMVKNNINVGDKKFSYCINDEEAKSLDSKFCSDLIGVHFPRGRYMLSPYYLNVGEEAKEQNFMEIKNHPRKYYSCNGVFRKI